MKSNFQRRLHNDSDLRGFFNEFLEEELKSAYTFLSKQNDPMEIYRDQGRIEFIKKLVGLSNVK